MTINFEYIVIAGSLVVSVSGFIVTAAIMLRSNKNGFVALKGDIDAIGEMFKIEKENAILFVKEVRRSHTKEMAGFEASLANIHGQFKSEIYPRLNAAERDIQKNCRALLDHKELCKEKHKH